VFAVTHDSHVRTKIYKAIILSLYGDITTMDREVGQSFY